VKKRIKAKKRISDHYTDKTQFQSCLYWTK